MVCEPRVITVNPGGFSKLEICWMVSNSPPQIASMAEEGMSPGLPSRARKETTRCAPWTDTTSPEVIVAQSSPCCSSSRLSSSAMPDSSARSTQGPDVLLLSGSGKMPFSQCTSYKDLSSSDNGSSVAGAGG